MNVMVITYRSELILSIVGVDALCLPWRSQWSHWAIGFGGRCLYLLGHLASPSLLVGLFVCLLLRQNLVLNPSWPQNCSVFLVSLLSAEITDMPPWVTEVYVLNILKHVGNTSKLRPPICFTKQVEENSETSWQYGDWWWRHRCPLWRQQPQGGWSFCHLTQMEASCIPCDKPALRTLSRMELGAIESSRCCEGLENPMTRVRISRIGILGHLWL